MPKPKSILARMSRLDADLENAPDYATWTQVAQEVDRATGAAEGREQTSPTIYNARLLRAESAELARRRAATRARNRPSPGKRVQSPPHPSPTHTHHPYPTPLPPTHTPVLQYARA